MIILFLLKIGGIGSVSEQLLNGVGVESCGDLYQKRAEIKLLFSNLNFEFNSNQKHLVMD